MIYKSLIIEVNFNKSPKKYETEETQNKKVWVVSENRIKILPSQRSNQWVNDTYLFSVIFIDIKHIFFKESIKLKGNLFAENINNSNVKL